MLPNQPFCHFMDCIFKCIISLTDGNATVSNLQNTEFVGQLDLVLLSDGGIAQFVPVEFDSTARLSPRGSKGRFTRYDLSHGTSSRQAYDMTYDCRSVLKHVLKCYDIFSDVHNNRKSFRGPVVSRCRMRQSRTV